MRKIFLILTVIFMGSLSSCDDLLEKTPYTSIPDFEMFTDVEGAQGALNGIYDRLTSANYYGRLIYAYEGSKGPDFYVEDTGNRFETENAYRETSVSSGYGTSAWNTIYKVVFLCNNVLANIDLIEGDENEIRRIKGEVYALRGLAYFDLMRLFAYPPIFSVKGGAKYNDKYKWGVPLILSQQDNIDAATDSPARDEAGVCYDLIISDFKTAITNLDGISASKGRVSYNAANALLARVYLYLGRWNDVISAGEIAATTGSMISYSDYNTTYYQPYNSENLWELDYSETDNLASNSLNYLVRNPTIDKPGDPHDGEIAANIGYAGYGGNVYLRHALMEIPTDVRQYLICDNELGDSTGIRKYIGQNGNHNVFNIPIVRLPEVYLTLAEAYAEVNNLAKAEENLNYVYEARTGLTYTATSQAQTITDVLAERRKELVLEGHTYWDHFRRSIPFDREPEGSVSDDVSHIDFENPSQTPTGTMYQFVYPIPQDEMEVNPNIRDQQNPGYTPYTGD
ncbi:MAG: RagB/SusD family nutrient uptake outer membrane protein [Chlorobi bacterium]|nr:RagB/SusD family nutrient uptake outer membrane protein [Chlorobiota bacterium]